VDKYDDMAGLPLWSIPKSSSETRLQFIKDSEKDLSDIKSIDLRTQDGVKLFHQTMNKFGFQFTEGTKEDEKILKIQQDNACIIMESLIEAAKIGKEGQTVLIATYQKDVLYGLCFDLENKRVYKTSVKIDMTKYTNQDAVLKEISDLTIGLTLEAWAKQQNAVIAWDAVSILCGCAF